MKLHGTMIISCLGIVAVVLLSACSPTLPASHPVAYSSWYLAGEESTRTYCQRQNDFADHDAVWGFTFRRDGKLPDYKAECPA